MRFSRPVQRGHLVHGASPEQVVEEHQEPVGGRKDAFVARPHIRPPPLPAHAAVRHGRDRRRPRHQERHHHRQVFSIIVNLIFFCCILPSMFFVCFL